MTPTPTQSGIGLPGAVQSSAQVNTVGASVGSLATTPQAKNNCPVRSLFFLQYFSALMPLKYPKKIQPFEKHSLSQVFLTVPVVVFLMIIARIYIMKKIICQLK